MINAIDVFAATNVIGKNAFKCRLCYLNIFLYF